MLTFKERAQVVKVLHYLCNLNVWPLRVDTQRWELRPGAETLWRTLACSVSYGLFLANTGYKVGSFLYVLFFLQDTPLHQIMIHGNVAVSFLMVTFWYYVLFIKNAGIHAKVFGMTLTGNIGEDTKG